MLAFSYLLLRGATILSLPKRGLVLAEGAVFSRHYHCRAHNRDDRELLAPEEFDGLRNIFALAVLDAVDYERGSWRQLEIVFHDEMHDHLPVTRVASTCDAPIRRQLVRLRFASVRANMAVAD